MKPSTRSGRIRCEPPEKVFYARAWDKVITQFSTTYWFMGYSGRHKMELAQLRAPTRLADFKNPQTVQPKVRKFFPDTIEWLPTLVTDAGGKARASFNFPDSLTTWRATVRAVTRDTLVGQVVAKVITRKNLILRLETPRFMDQGDTATLIGNRPQLSRDGQDRQGLARRAGSGAGQPRGSQRQRSQER